MLFDILELVKETSIELYGCWNELYYPYGQKDREVVLDKINDVCEEKQYRRKYELLTNIVTPKGFEIHHIDQNRDNYHINNLVLLPKYLHKKYHTYKQHADWLEACLKQNGLFLETKLKNFDQIDLDHYDTINFLIDLKKVVKVCGMWVELRDCVFNIAPNRFEFRNNYKYFLNKEGFCLREGDLIWERP